MRKFHRRKDVIMSVISHNTFCLCSNGTSNEFIIIRISFNKLELIEWYNKFGKRTVYYCLYNILGYFIIDKTLNYLNILIKNFI